MKFLDTLYVRAPQELHHIINFGRAPQQREQDAAQGIARIGGPLREPNYAQAYIHSAEVLVRSGEAADTLDEIALPAFYLQRHATELLLKQVLAMVIEISSYAARSESKPPIHSNSQKERLDGSHKLQALRKDLVTLAAGLDLPAPPQDLLRLVDSVTAVEKTETWTRYSTSKDKSNRTTIHHLEREVVIPLRLIQEQLRAASIATAYRATGEDSYEADVYDVWRSYALQFGDIE